MVMKFNTEAPPAVGISKWIASFSWAIGASLFMFRFADDAYHKYGQMSNSFDAKTTPETDGIKFIEFSMFYSIILQVKNQKMNFCD